MSLLPIFQTKSTDIQLLQTKWASILNPFLRRPQNNSLILHDVRLIPGINVINHMLGEDLQGWSIVRKNAAAEIYDQQSTNPNKGLTLILISDALVTVSIELF